ncbi:hypothetical protein FDI24_gp058 [Acidovorax phage ACP17]|uniref:Uncharacterized protein n=1 Tax=Acidovorax phage ACP17 TaxID=2010329 RepID=A0A223AIZ3_9CAUD|nr:hypothetical protein FDI24_gp058 [Acidovorax phage ACP17]ASS33924.1 hypothetical protein [Acidovorax phage ACP17]
MSQVKMMIAGKEAMVDADQVKFYEKKAEMVREARMLKDELDVLIASGLPSSDVRIALDKKISKISSLNKKLKPVTFL